MITLLYALFGIMDIIFIMLIFIISAKVFGKIFKNYPTIVLVLSAIIVNFVAPVLGAALGSPIAAITASMGLGYFMPFTILMLFGIVIIIVQKLISLQWFLTKFVVSTPFKIAARILKFIKLVVKQPFRLVNALITLVMRILTMPFRIVKSVFN